MMRISFHIKRLISLGLCSMLGFGTFSLSMPTHCRSVAENTVFEAKAECIMELYSRRVLYEKQGDIRLPMASTTKIATAITVLEHCKDIKEKFLIPEEAEGVEGSSVYLKSGEVYTIEDLLYGLMLRSGNDCAKALALYCSGSIQDFSAKMNQTAQRAGALNTHFKNPHGLPCDGHYTTAKDLCFISCYAMENPVFRKLVATKYYEPRYWKNKNKILQIYEGGIGVKTGYTKEAGRCLVSAAQRGNMTLVCTVLNCSTTYERCMELLDDAFSCYSNRRLLEKYEKVEVISGDKKIIGETHEEFVYPLMEGETEQIERRIIPVIDEEIVGQIQIWLSKRLLFSTNLYKL